MKKLTIAYIFLIMLGGLLTSAELTMLMLHSSLCSSAGCRIVESYLKFDERYMYAIGFIFFCSLYLTEHMKSLSRYSHLLVMSALAAEGYLVGFQFFVAHTFCPVCISVASIIAGISLLKLISGAKEPILFGIYLFVLTFSLVGSINATSTPIPTDRHVLIYSKECPHCEEVIRFCKERSIPLKLIEAGEVKGALGWMGIDAVPILVCNDDDGKKIYSGAKTIEAVLTAKSEPFTKETLTKAGRAETMPRQMKGNINQKSSEMNNSYKNSEFFIYSGSASYSVGANDGVCSVGKSNQTCE